MCSYVFYFIVYAEIRAHIHKETVAPRRKVTARMQPARVGFNLLYPFAWTQAFFTRTQR